MGGGGGGGWKDGGGKRTFLFFASLVSIIHLQGTPHTHSLFLKNDRVVGLAKVGGDSNHRWFLFLLQTLQVDLVEEEEKMKKARE